jgi:(p)ppGpp synthase/HD superfamily hydrolase
MRVAGWASLMRDQQPEYVAAAWLHDVQEDNSDFWLKIERQVLGSVRIIVDQLTNPSKKRPDLNRADRKKMDREHIAASADCTKVIKMIDRYDNLCDVVDGDRGFQCVYAKESLLLVEAVRPVLFDSDLTPWCNAVDQQANKLLA